jgi:hypothetical protein
MTIEPKFEQFVPGSIWRTNTPIYISFADKELTVKNIKDIVVLEAQSIVMAVKQQVDPFYGLILFEDKIYRIYLPRFFAGDGEMCNLPVRIL